MQLRSTPTPRPLATSLARLTSAAAVCAALQLSCSPPAKAATWDGGGDGFLWSTPANWSGDLLPAEFDDVVFGLGAPGTIQLNGDQTVTALTFNQNFTLGSYGDRNKLIVVGDVTVTAGTSAVINSDFAATSSLHLSGGGKLLLNNFSNSFTGTVTATGSGTQLTLRSQGVLPYINNVGHVILGRTNQNSLGPISKTVNLQEGAELRIVGNGLNPDGGNNIALGTGGGALNLPAGWQQMQIDDGTQISGSGSLTKNGAGRLLLTSQDYLLEGNLILNGGVLELGRLLAGGAGGTRYSSFASTSNFIINGGMLMPNTGTTQGRVDNPITLNGGALTVQGVDSIYGLDASAVTMTLNGGSILVRDAYNPQQNRAPRIRNQVVGSGTVDIVGATGNTAGTFVLERSGTDASTFSGVFRLLGTARLENNPRVGTPFFGKTIGSATVELNGFNSTLDLRDSGGAAVVTNTLFNSGTSDYTTNTINVTTPQIGALPSIIVNRSGDTGTPASTGNVFNIGTLNIGNNRLFVTNGNSYGLAFNTVNLTGNAVFDQNATPVTFLGGVSESVAGMSLTKTQRTVNPAASADMIAAGAISVSNILVSNGTLQLRGTGGAITTGVGGAAPTITINGGETSGAVRGNSIQGILHLDSNGSSVGVAAGNNNNRVVDSATVRMFSNSVLRLTSNSNNTTTETIGNLNVVAGHALIDVVKTGTPTLAPVALTINALTLANKSTVNFTGTSLGAPGVNSSRIILPTGTAAGFLGSAFHSGNEWAKYDTTVDGTNGIIGVTPFVAADYTVGNAETLWDNTQHNKQTAAAITMTADRSLLTLNLQNTAAQTLNTAGFKLAIEGGGLLSSGSAASGIVGTAGVGALTAGSTPGTSTLYAHVTNTLDIKVPVVDNGSPVTFVKSGTGTVRLTHHSLGVGTGGTDIVPFTTPTWTSTLTGGWVINDGVLQVHRGQFLGGAPVTLNGGTLEINQPVSTTGGNSILPGWGNNIIVNGNALIGADDNGESQDSRVGGNTIALLGSLAINNGATLGFGSFNNIDVAFMNGASLSGTPSFNLGVGRTATNSVAIINGAVTGSGFDVVNLNGAPGSLVLGGTATDQSNNTFDGRVVVYGGTLRLNKANGFNAIPNGTAAEDVIINGGALAWGPGHHGDLSTTNNPTINSNQIGLANLSPAALRAAGQNQIADGAVITMLSGSLGETDRIQNDFVGGLNMFGGTLNSGNAGEGMLEFGIGNIAGGAVAFNWATHLKFGTLNLLPGAPALVLNNGFLARQTILEVGAGGLTLAGSRIELSSGGLSNLAGAGTVLRLGGNVTVNSDPLNGTSLAGQGIFSGIGGNMREFSNSYIDLMGGTRDFNVADGLVFGISSLMKNGGFSKSGTGILDVQQYAPKFFDGDLFSGAVVVNAGTLIVRSNAALGTSAGGVTINTGGTLKIDGNLNTADAFTITGAGANVSGTTDIREFGALVVEQGQMTISGPVTLGGSATLAPSITQLAGVGNNPSTRAGLFLTNPSGITGAGTLTLSGFGDGRIAGGVNTTSGGLVKDGSGRWVLGGNGSYLGSTTVEAGVLTIASNAALGSTAAGTTVFGGATLELAGGITVGTEALTLNGDGFEEAGALRNVSGSNSWGGAITLGTATTLRSDSGALSLDGTISGVNRALTFVGAGDGAVQGAITLGTAGLNKLGTGTWTLRGNNTFAGPTSLQGGTLALDYTVNNGSKLSSSFPLSLAGGNLAVLGSATATTTQAIGGLVVGPGGGRVSVANGAGQSATLNLGAISQLPGGTVDFVLPVAGAIATTSPNINGILGGYATVGGVDWARVASGNIAALTTYTTLPSSAATNTNNSQVTASQVQGGDVATNSLKITAGAGLATRTAGVTLASGGLLFTGTDRTAISGTGLVSAANADSDLSIHTASGILDISNPLIGSGAGGLNKAGAGVLVLRGVSDFAGAININDGTLAIVGPGGTTHPTALGSGLSARNININGGTFSVLGGDYDVALNTMQLVVNQAGGTFNVRDGSAGGSLLINDAGQFSGTGDLHLTGGGRLAINNAYPEFTGNVYVDQGVLRGNNVSSFGGRKGQTITLAPGTAFITDAGGAGTTLGIPNDIVANGSQIFSTGGDRALGGDIHFTGVNTIGLIERDTVNQNRSLTLNGRVTGSGIINVFGHNQGVALGAGGNGNFVFLSSSSNTFEGVINLKPNAGLEARIPGSLGSTPGAITVNLETNSRLLLRGPASGDFMANVVVNGPATINADRIAAGGASFGSGDRTQLAINNLTVNNGAVLGTLSSGNNYTLRVNGSATFNGAANVFAESANIALVNGMTFTSPTADFNKYGSFGVFLFDEANNSGGTTIVHNGGLFLRGTEGVLRSNRVELRGQNAALYIDNGDGANPDRVSDSGTLVLGGGSLRVNGTESSLGAVLAPGGHNTVAYTLASLDTTTTLQLGTSFSRSNGATFSFVSDNGTIGLSNTNQFRAQPRITIPGQADVASGDIIPWAVSGNEFVRYDGTTLDGGAPLGVITVTNNSVGNYINDPADTALLSGNIIRLTGTNTTTQLAASRTVRAIKMDGGDPALNATARRMDLNGANLTVDRGLIIHVNQTQNIGNSSATTVSRLTSGNGELTAVVNAGTLDIGPGSYTAADSTTTSGTAVALAGEVIISNGAGLDGTFGNADDVPVTLVKSGGGALDLRNIANASTFTGGVFVNQGTLRAYRGANLGPNTNTLTLNGGTLEIHSDEAGDPGTNLAGLGHNVVVNGNAQLNLDNGPTNLAANVSKVAAMGSLTVTGPYILQIGGFDGYDWSFTGASFAGTPIIDVGLGRTSLVADLSSTTINGVVSGSGFQLITGNVTAASVGTLQLAGATANTYTGTVTVYDAPLQLNKTAGANAITGDLNVIGGGNANITWLQDNQMADTGVLSNTRGNINFNGKQETIAGIVMTGGSISTGNNAVLNVTGDVVVSGTNSGNGFLINDAANVTITGKLKIPDFGRVVLAAGGSGSFLTIGGLELTGTNLAQNNGAGPNTVRLLGDVTTFAAPIPAGLGLSGDSDTYLELSGNRTFNVADGPSGIDLSLSTVVRNVTAPAGEGGLIKEGDGLMVIQGGGTANSYSGTTFVKAGTVELFKNVGVNALGNGTGALTIGDGVGGPEVDRVVVRNNEQIANATSVTIASSGQLDLATFNTNETIASLAGQGTVDLGPTSALIVNGSANTVYEGAIRGGGTFVKDGGGTLELTGTSDVAGGSTIQGAGVLVVSGALSGSVLVTGTAALRGEGMIDGPVAVQTGATLAPGSDVGTLSTGSVDLQSGSTFSLQINGTTAALYDSLKVTGGVTLAGNLAVNFGFTPGLDTFTLILNDGIDPVVGTFAGLAEGDLVGTFNGADARITYFGNADGGAIANDVLLIVPEPASATMLLAGLGMTLGIRRFRRRG